MQQIFAAISIFNNYQSFTDKCIYPQRQNNTFGDFYTHIATTMYTFLLPNTHLIQRERHALTQVGEI